MTDNNIQEKQAQQATLLNNQQSMPNVEPSVVSQPHTMDEKDKNNHYIVITVLVILTALIFAGIAVWLINQGDEEPVESSISNTAQVNTNAIDEVAIVDENDDVEIDTERAPTVEEIAADGQYQYFTQETEFLHPLNDMTKDITFFYEALPETQLSQEVFENGDKSDLFVFTFGENRLELRFEYAGYPRYFSDEEVANLVSLSGNISIDRMQYSSDVSEYYYYGTAQECEQDEFTGGGSTMCGATSFELPGYGAWSAKCFANSASALETCDHILTTMDVVYDE